MKSKLLLILSFLFLFSGCSKEAGKTNANVKIQLAGITNFSSGIGSGGVLLFGKSATTGEQFGKIINGAQETLDLPNGSWSFYAVMWDSSYGTHKFSGASYCGKVSRVLSGTSVDISMNLNNASCADSEFSNGDSYTDGTGKKHFADFSIEECDELSKSTSSYCRAENQGSALSYRMVFKSYKRSSGAAPVFSDDAYYSQCMKANGIPSMLNFTMNFNFPSSKNSMPFIASLEMFLGSSDCGEMTAEAKGKYVQVFSEGIGAESSLVNKFAKSSSSVCTAMPATKNLCEDYLGSWAGGVCTVTGPTVMAFVPAASCGGAVTSISSKHIKQMVEIPKSFLCRNTNYYSIGNNVFPGGDGSLFRPYKICNEWQLNQIGETTSIGGVYENSSFKLMKDLDMNVTDFNPLLRPNCIGMGGMLGSHHNLNPLNTMTDGDCVTTGGGTYRGVFNGNNKSISNGRIIINGPTGYIGFVRSLGTNGVIKNVTFKNLEVSSTGTQTGGVAGWADASSTISNVKILGGDIDGNSSVGAISPHLGVGAVISDVEVRDVRVHASFGIGGLVAFSSGSIIDSMFRGSIKQYNSVDSSTGGLVGVADLDSSILRSFSEGTIESSAKYTGGVAGSNAGTINDVYSNMYIRSRSHELGTVIGGIIGSNSSASTNVLRVYSDSVLKYEGYVSGVVVDGVVAAGVALNPSECFSTSTNSFSGCGVMGDIRIGGIGMFTNVWKADVTGTLPRLTWEFNKGQRICLNTANSSPLSVQTTLNRGSILNPYIICNGNQLKELEGSSSDKYYSIGEDIGIKNWWNDSHIISSFGGHLNGNNFSIYGMNIVAASAGNRGLISFNTGTISNLNFVGNSVSNTQGGAVGVLAGASSGYINNVEFIGNEVEGTNSVGMVTGANSGVIDNVSVDRGRVRGLTFVGGIAGSNSNSSGLISRASSDADIIPSSGASEKIGGIVGYNSTGATVDQVVYSGGIEFIGYSTVGAAVKVGGIAGANNGQIQNSMTKNQVTINVFNNDYVGGLVGLNESSGSIKTSFNLGRIVYEDPTYGNPVPASSKMSGIAGFNQGTLDNKTYYLENNVGAEIIRMFTDVACNGSIADFQYLSPTILTVGTNVVDLFAPVFSNLGNDGIKTFNTFIVSLADTVPYFDNCLANTDFQFLKSYEDIILGKKMIADFNNINTFSGYDIAYDSKGAGGDLRLDALLEYHKAKMENRAPAIAPPIWEFEAGDGHPRLLQVND